MTKKFDESTEHFIATNTEDYIKELAEWLGLKPRQIPPKPPMCGWCSGRCGVKPSIYYNNEHYKGWFSPPCAHLADEASNACDEDDS